MLSSPAAPAIGSIWSPALSEKRTIDMSPADSIRQKRRLIFFLSALTSALFLGFVTVIAVAPDLLSGPVIISVGFLLIVLSVIIVSAFGVWANRFAARQDEGRFDA